jgi:biotin synthase-like enzyme
MNNENFEETPQLVKQAQVVYEKHFPAMTTFERAVFFSWGCTIGDCTFCYMSTQPKGKAPKETKRSVESILAEFMLAKELEWDIGFFTGGIGVLSPTEMEFLLKAANEIAGQKIWLSVGPIQKPLLQRYLPYIRGVVGSTETVNPVLHKIVCPSKPLAPYEKMFETAGELGLEKAMTFIVGMGETKKDLELLLAFIAKYTITKIHVYSLIPEKGTMFEHTPMPSKEQQAWWIAQLRINCPTLNIQCGIWEDRVERVEYLLRAGANSISKFKAIKLFNSPEAREIESQANVAGRKFKGTLTRFQEVNWEEKIEQLSFDAGLKERIRQKLKLYLKQMKVHK